MCHGVCEMRITLSPVIKKLFLNSKSNTTSDA